MLISRATASHSDLIVLDIGLPVLDGPGFAAKWHARADAAGVPIVVVSGRLDGRAVAAAMHAAAVCCKPLDLGTLTKLVRSLLAKPPATFAGAD